MRDIKADHMKLLRDHPERKADERFKLLEASVDGTMAVVHNHLEKKVNEFGKSLI